MCFRTWPDLARAEYKKGDVRSNVFGVHVVLFCAGKRGEDVGGNGFKAHDSEGKT